MANSKTTTKLKKKNVCTKKNIEGRDRKVIQTHKIHKMLFSVFFIQNNIKTNMNDNDRKKNCL